MHEGSPRGRGRPREVWRAGPGTGLPIGRGLDDLSPTGRSILAAAREMAAKEGVGALTLRGVAERAYVDLSTVKYHFGTKAGLLEALLDSLYRDDVTRFAAAAAGAESVAARIDAYFRMAEQQVELESERMRLYYELECFALRDPFLAERLATYNRWLVESLLGIVFGQGRAARELEAPGAPAFWALVAAAIDGIGMHYSFAPAEYPLKEALGLLRDLMRYAHGIETELRLTTRDDAAGAVTDRTSP